MRDQVRVAKKQPPYLFEYYNVFRFWKSSANSRHTIGRVLNAFINALNQGRCLPRFLLIILDKDVIEDVNVFDYGAAKELLKNVQWLIRQINIEITRKRAEITDAKPGALYSTNPKVVLLSMIRRPLHFPSRSRMENVVSLCTKFNDALNEVAEKYEYSILTVDACDSENHFDLLGN